MSQALRLNVDEATALLDYLVHNGKAQAYAFVVHLSRAMQLAETSEELRDVIRSYTGACIPNSHLKALVLLSVALLNLDEALLCELDRIFHQVNEDLLVPSLISNEKCGLHRAGFSNDAPARLGVVLILVACGAVKMLSSDCDAFGLSTRSEHVNDKVDYFFLIEWLLHQREDTLPKLSQIE